MRWPAAERDVTILVVLVLSLALLVLAAAWLASVLAIGSLLFAVPA